MIFVTDASQELTGPEVAFLRQALERCPAAVCVVTKTDLYPAWRRIVELDRRHLANAGIELPVIPVSSFLRLRAWRSPALNEESGFAPLFDWLRSGVLENAATLAVAAATRDLGFVQEQLRLEVAAEQQVLAKPEASDEVVGALRRRSERTRKLVERGNGWQQFLFDGIDQLIADVKHDLASRMRTVVRDVEAVIEQGDPKDTWPDIEVWLQRQVVRAANENHELLNERAAQLATDVAETFALESEEPLELGLTAPVDVLRGLSFDPAQLAAPDSQKLVRMLFAGRAALIPATARGLGGELAAGSLLLLAARTGRRDRGGVHRPQAHPRRAPAAADLPPPAGEDLLPALPGRGQLRDREGLPRLAAPHPPRAARRVPGPGGRHARLVAASADVGRAGHHPRPARARAAGRRAGRRGAPRSSGSAPAAAASRGAA